MNSGVLRLFMACGAIGLLAAGLSAPPASASDQILMAAAAGYRANLEGFVLGTCRGTCTRGFAKSFDDALAGRFLDTPRTAPVFWARDGSEIRFRIVEDAETKKILDAPNKRIEMMPGGLLTSPLVPFITSDKLSSAGHVMSHDPRHRTATIHEGGAAGKAVDEHFILSALNIDSKDDFAELARQAQRGELTCRVEMLSDGSRPLIRVSFQKPASWLRLITLSPSQGYLPVRIETSYPDNRSGMSVHYTVTTGIQACSGGRWFPQRVVTYYKEPTQTSGLVWIYEITEFDPDNRPTREVFQLTLPAGTVINRASDPRIHFITRQREQVTPDDLARVYEMTEQKQRNPLMDTAIRRPSRAWMWYTAAGVGLFLAAVGYVFRRRLGTARRPNGLAA